MDASSTAAIAVEDLRGRVRGAVATPGDPDYDALRACWNRSYDQRPDVIVEAADADDVVAALAWAHTHALPVAVQSTGHGAGTTIDAGLLLKTSRLDDVTVDADARTATVGAGARWSDVLEKTALHGLAPLLGFSAGVGVVGYTLGGGLGWLGRAYGMAVDSVRALDVVTPDGRRVSTTPTEEPDLFWALRGAGAAFGAVVAIELSLVEPGPLTGGTIFYPGERATEVIAAYADWTSTLPETVTSSVAILRVPPDPAIPAPLRGRTVVMIGLCAIADPVETDRLLAPIRALGEPIADLVRPLGVGELGEVAMDPTDPMPTWGHADLVEDLTPEIQALLAGTAEGEQPLAVVEARQLGGAFAREREPSAAARPQAGFVFHAEAVAPPGPQGEPARQAIQALADAIGPHAQPGLPPSFIGEAEPGADHTALCFSPATRARLITLQRRYDPDRRFRFGRVVVAPEWGA